MHAIIRVSGEFATIGYSIPDIQQEHPDWSSYDIVDFLQWMLGIYGAAAIPSQVQRAAGGMRPFDRPWKGQMRSCIKGEKNLLSFHTPRFERWVTF